MSKKLINGLKYEKLTQDQLHDLSRWELVDIILAYRKDLKAKKKECKELKETFDGLFKVQYKLADNNKKLRQCLTEIKEIAEENDELLQGYHTEWANNKIILYKISECEGSDE